MYTLEALGLAAFAWIANKIRTAAWAVLGFGYWFATTTEAKRCYVATVAMGCLLHVAADLKEAGLLHGYVFARRGSLSIGRTRDS